MDTHFVTYDQERKKKANKLNHFTKLVYTKTFTNDIQNVIP